MEFLSILTILMGMFLLVLAIMMPYFVLQIRNSSEKTAQELAKVNQNLLGLLAATQKNSSSPADLTSILSSTSAIINATKGDSPSPADPTSTLSSTSAIINAANGDSPSSADSPSTEYIYNLAICPACDNRFPFGDSFKGEKITCTFCKMELILPQSVSLMSRTGKAQYADKPAIIPLPPAQDRPGISRAKCGSCDKLLTYPEKQTSREVKCPGCQAAFALP